MSEAAHARIEQQSFCQHCGGKLHLGYHFTCHICGDSYCYIHMAKHARAHAPRQVPEKVYAR